MRARWTLLEALVIGLAILAVAAASLLVTGTASGSEADEYTRSDRLQHEAAGAVIGLGSFLLVDRLPATRELPRWQKAALALVPVVLAAVGKEALDSRHPERHDCDARDAVATVLGGCVAVTLVWRF